MYQDILQEKKGEVSDMAKFKDLLGHRIIYDSSKSSYLSYTELKILELSPSGKRVKVSYASGSEIWEDIKTDNNYYGGLMEKRIIEDLGKYK